MEFEEIPREKWPQDAIYHSLEKVFSNKDFTVQLVRWTNGVRLCITKNPKKKPTNMQKIQYQQGITWDELFEIKNSLGYINKWAVECHPPIDVLQNITNMRHLWILNEEPEFGFKVGLLP